MLNLVLLCTSGALRWDGVARNASGPLSGLSAVSNLCALCVLCGFFLFGCDETLPAPETPAPTLTLEQSGTNTVDLAIAGRYSLRALQARLVYDSSTLRLTRVQAGPEAARIDRVFFSDPARADGSATIGITDTRKVLLPARGSLFRFTFQAKSGGKGTVKIASPRGALDGGKRVDLAETSLGVVIK